MSKEAVISVAKGELGYTENPKDSNLQKYGYWFGVNGVPWCVIFLAWIFDKAGEKAAFFGGAKTASCGTLLRWYKEQGQTVSANQIQPGDIVILNFHGTQDTEHCGLVIEVGNGYFVTIEGNTTNGNGSQDNGGMVCEKHRYRYQVVGVCRPMYKAEEPKTDYENHWAKEDIEWAKRTGIIKGYEDGTFRPNNTLTRAEFVAVLRRYDEYRFGGSEK